MTARRLCLTGLLLAVTAACAGEPLVPPPPPGPPPPGPQPPPPPPPPPPSGTWTVAWGTFVGGNDFEELREPVILPDGRLLFGARTKSTNMPTAPGGWRRTLLGNAAEGDSWLGILSVDGSRLEAGTYFGGSGMERPPYGIALAADGDVVFGSGTASADIPVSANAYRRTLAGNGGVDDGYACRISATLSALRWCTYLGAWPRGGLALDAAGNVLVSGNTTVIPFQPTPGVFQPAVRGVADAFVLKLAADGSRALWAAVLGGSSQTDGETGLSLQVFPGGDVSLSGISRSADFPTTPGVAQPATSGPPDAFVARIAASGSTLMYATLAGGTGTDAAEHRHALRSDGTVFLTGVTQSTNLPGAINAHAGGDDGFVVQVAPDASQFLRVRYLGGSGQEHVLGPVVDNAGLIYLFGSTNSPDFPVTTDALQRTLAGGHDGFLAILNPDFSLRYATYLGGNGDELVRGAAVDANGDVYLIGRTGSANFPVSAGAFQRTYGGGTDDGFVLKLKAP